MAYQQQPPYGYNPQQGYPNQPQYGQPQGQYGQPQPGWAPGVGNEYSRLSGVPPTMNYHAAPNYAEEGSGPKADIGFNDASIRAAFIRKVFIMVSVMLAVVAVMSAIPFIHKPMQLFIRQNIALYYVSYGTFLVVYITLMCCEGVRRSFPANMICTAILTLSIGYMTMMICSMYDIVSVMLCLIITTAVSGSIIVFASVTKHDLTSKMGILFIFSMVLMIFGLVAIISVMVFHVRWLYTIYAGLAALLFMFYLAVDVQMLMGGRKYEISPEDHVFAAIQIFMDIIYIFWMLLQLFGGGSRD